MRITLIHLYSYNNIVKNTTTGLYALLIGFGMLLRPLTLTLTKNEQQINVQVNEDVAVDDTNIQANKTKFKVQGKPDTSR